MIKTAARILIPLLIAVGAITAPGSASAHDVYGPGRGCMGYSPAGTTWGTSCYQYYGDDHWVRDSKPDGWSVGIHIKTSYGKERWCENRHGYDDWHECNLDHREYRCVKWQLYQFKYNWWGLSRGNTTGYTPWINTGTGHRC